MLFIQISLHDSISHICFGYCGLHIHEVVDVNALNHKHCIVCIVLNFGLTVLFHPIYEVYLVVFVSSSSSSSIMIEGNYHCRNLFYFPCGKHHFGCLVGFPGRVLVEYWKFWKKYFTALGDL